MNTQPGSSIAFAGAADTHVHVFDSRRFPFAASRSYTPGEASVDALSQMHRAHGIERVVLVQPSVYGTDNRCLLNAVDTLGQDRARGVAVVDLDTASDQELGELHEAGVRGIRLNLKVLDAAAQASARRSLLRAASLLGRSDWCLQVHGPRRLLPTLVDCIGQVRATLVLDHFAGLCADDVAQHSSALDSLLRLLDTGRVYVKLSAPYRVSGQAPHFGDLASLAHALIRAQPRRMLWGSDWPHTGGDGVRRVDPLQVEPFRHVDKAATLHSLAAWAGDDITLRRILVDNPAELYGLAPPRPPAAHGISHIVPAR